MCCKDILINYLRSNGMIFTDLRPSSIGVAVMSGIDSRVYPVTVEFHNHGILQMGFLVPLFPVPDDQMVSTLEFCNSHTNTLGCARTYVGSQSYGVAVDDSYHIHNVIPVVHVLPKSGLGVCVSDVLCVSEDNVIALYRRHLALMREACDCLRGFRGLNF